MHITRITHTYWFCQTGRACAPWGVDTTCLFRTFLFLGASLKSLGRAVVAVLVSEAKEASCPSQQAWALCGV